jgi:hypothetical protein
MDLIISDASRIFSAFKSIHLILTMLSFFLDDVIADRSAMIWNKSLNEFFVLGRHLCISIFLLTQHVKGVGPMLRGNADVIVLQPIFQHEARMVLADLYGGWMEHREFEAIMDEVVYDKNLPGSTPQEPKKEVRTLIINDYENTRSVQMKFRWYMAEDVPDKANFKLLPEVYWKESSPGGGGQRKQRIDPIDELDKIQNQIDQNL